MGSRSTFVLCTVTDFCFPCHPWHNRMKEVYTEGSLWKNKSGRWLVRSRRKFPWDNETWAAGLFKLHACTTFINWAPPRGCHSPPRLYSPRLLIVRQLKNGTAKTIPRRPWCSGQNRAPISWLNSPLSVPKYCCQMYSNAGLLPSVGILHNLHLASSLAGSWLLSLQHLLNCFKPHHESGQPASRLVISFVHRVMHNKLADYPCVRFPSSVL